VQPHQTLLTSLDIYKNMRVAFFFIGMFAICFANAQVSNSPLNDWLVRWHEASKKRAYTGTFVVSTHHTISSAKIWHVCDGQQQLERVDALTGPARTTIRRNEDVVTFVPESKLSISEKRESLNTFPSILHASTPTLGEHYTLKRPAGSDRVAGFEVDVVELAPRDDWRFGYRIWSEKKSGLILKLQTLDAQSSVLEQVAFSELQFDVPIRIGDLLRAMKQRSGYSGQKIELIRTTPETQGWRLKHTVSGFTTVACHFRAPSQPLDSAPALQWVLSDGLASVSAFIEHFDPNRHLQEGQMVSGSTHSLSRRYENYWVTWVGEVPLKTLLRFATALEHASTSHQ
jgi:sigma-E factor negative regulatory protein RseB